MATHVNVALPKYKRPYDLVIIGIACLALIPLWIPLCAVLALTIYIVYGKPMFYTQNRLGLGGRVFRIIKFRTMINDAEKHTGPIWAQRNDPRVTKLGRLLRHTHLDELPQVINIIKGEMSLVGPRPERPELTAIFETEIPGFRKRLDTLPGLAPLSHVRGNSHTPPRHRLRYDILYIQHMSPCLDTYVLIMTAILVIKRIFNISREN